MTEQGNHVPYMEYLYKKLKDRFSFLSTAYRIKEEGERASLEFSAEKKYSPYIRKCAEENIAEIIAIAYKYAYFKEILCLPLLKEEEKDTLYCSLVSADFLEDRTYIKSRMEGVEEYCIDGTYHFRLSELKKRWSKIAEYIPTEFDSFSLENFVDFLVEEGENRVFLKDGFLYDEEYKPLTRSCLIGKMDLRREILLSGAGQVYCFGKPKEGIGEFLKKYYKEKVVFC